MQTKIRVIAGGVILCSWAYAQSFDVVSIKPHQSNQRARFSFERLRGDHEVRATTTLGNLIQLTYHSTLWDIVEPKDAPWVDQDDWDLDAKSDQPLTESGMIARLKNLLADRFKLRIEAVQRPGTVYILTVDPGGLKIVKNEDTPRSELMVGVTRDGKFFLRGTAITMGQFIFSQPLRELNMRERSNIIDSTGLSDRYDVHWVLGDGESDPFDPDNLIETCKRQLGLKLEKAKGQVEMINVVHVEKPTEN